MQVLVFVLQTSRALENHGQMWLFLRSFSYYSSVSFLSPFSRGSFSSICREPEQQHWLIRSCLFEASNLAVGSGQTGTEFVFSFKICWVSWWKHNFISSKTYSPSIQGLFSVLIPPHPPFQSGSLLMKRKPRFYSCGYCFYCPPDATYNILPHNKINLNSAV